MYTFSPPMSPADSLPQSPFGVVCPKCGPQGLTHGQYRTELRRHTRPWSCPRCKNIAEFDEPRLEKYHND